MTHEMHNKIVNEVIKATNHLNDSPLNDNPNFSIDHVNIHSTSND